MSNIEGEASLLDIFNTVSRKVHDLPANFKEIPRVNVYEANGNKGDDWKTLFKDLLGVIIHIWIITPLWKGPDSKYIRIAAGGGRWDSRGLCSNGDTSWEKRGYRLDTKDKGTGLPTYTMVEYSPAGNNATHALCRITKNNAHDKPLSTSQKRKCMEIDHRDSNKEEKGETSLSEESMQQGGNFQNARQCCNPSNLEMSASNSYAKKPTSLRRDTNRNYSEFGNQSSQHGNCNEKNAEHGTNTINLATIPEPGTQDELWQLCDPDGHEMVELIQLSPNLIANPTEATDNQNRIPPDPSTSFIPTTDGGLDHLDIPTDWLTKDTAWKNFI